MSIPAAFANKVKCSAEGLPEPGLLIRNAAGQPECGKLNPNSTCLADQCCSPSGFCGPFVSNGVYNEGGKDVTKDVAVALYCTDKSQGDWRNWKSAGQCTDTGVRYPAGPDAPPLIVPKKTTSTTKSSTSTTSSSAASGTSTPTATPLPVDGDDSGGVSVGAIAGILVGVIAAAAVVVYLFVAMRRKRMQKEEQQHGGKDILQEIDAMPNVITVDSDHHHDSTSHGDLSSNRVSAHHFEEDRMALNPAVPALMLPGIDSGSRPSSTAPSDARMSHLTSRKQRTASLQALSVTSAPEPNRTPSPAPISPVGLDRAGTVRSTTAHVGTPTTAAPTQDPSRLYLPPLPPMHGNDAVGGAPSPQPRPLSAPPLDGGDSDLYLPPAVPLAPPAQLQTEPSPGISLQLPEATMPRPSSPTRPTSMLQPVPAPSAGAPALARFTRAIESGAMITGPRRCLHALNPTNPDELRLDVGDMVEVVRVFGDAWALGKVAGRGDAEGFFPLAVLEPVEGDEVLLALHADLVGAASVAASTETTLRTSSGLGRTASLARRSQW
ncbi:hypothetical protein AMAG_20231 [Allomyces macrogynus ATCC 38327]|uniref:SH3 domain-containing protein n=1 Tax=Allomyces macrogynus (strain ATCC 38327) TaxID=578462 RepID=A0A0L0T5P7_ALLM3|nr:hypothetical protein AMAG_20231 [Allomyces macrogynus ATCC 38327]|eukprot:KNE70070.1 hypothetical protein AMAG_20231 [Allomyces macrogynus ATCC 38327]